MAYTLIQAKPVSYGGTRSLSSVKYIVIHYTAGNGDTALNEVRYFANGNTRAAGAHFFCDQSGTVYQSIPLNRVAWSVGGFYTKVNGAGTYYNICTNSNSVSIELCDNLNKDPSSKQISATKTLVAYIQSQCPNAKTIIRHWDVNGKSCPARMAGPNNVKWNSFRAAISGGDGWKKINDIWYYYINGSFVIGWLKDGGTWYYLKNDGSMAVGWQKVKGVWYYLKSNGAMATGWIKDKGKWYYLTSSGAMATGWIKYKDKWYYLKNSGEMVTGTIRIDNKKYSFASSGELIEK